MILIFGDRFNSACWNRDGGRLDARDEIVRLSLGASRHRDYYTTAPTFILWNELKRDTRIMHRYMNAGRYNSEANLPKLIRIRIDYLLYALVRPLPPLGV